jgi:hypothetical protein
VRKTGEKTCKRVALSTEIASVHALRVHNP